MSDNIQAMASSDGVSVHSGFPNPAAEKLGRVGLSLDLNNLLIKHPSSTYIFRIAGHSHADQSIYDGDLAVIDRARPSKPSDLMLAWQNEDFVICRRHQLLPESKPWGVVVAIIHKYY